MAAKREVCKQTKKFMDDPNFKDHNPVNGVTNNWQGRVYVLDAEKSEISSIIGVEEKGEYAIKVR